MSNLDEDMRPEYDFSGGVRGKHYQTSQPSNNVVLLDPDVAGFDNIVEPRLTTSNNVVLLDPDVAAHFKDAQAVNHALRLLIQLAGQEVKPKIDVTDKAA